VLKAFKWVKENVFPGVAVSLATLVFIVLCGEAYLRLTAPFTETQWVSRFDAKLGFVFEPGVLIRHTNDIEYWTEQRANSWGFLDLEPSFDKSSQGMCTIAFIGDSFVEAAQVPIEQKFHRLLETHWNRTYPSNPLRTQAFGYSGTGQSNQLAWLALIEKLHPKLIVLVFVSNDFGNNNVWLEAARNGWHPEHPPRPFLIKGQLHPPAPDWREHLLPGQTGSTQAAWSRDRGDIGDWGHHKLWKLLVYRAFYKVWVGFSYRASAYYANVPDAVRELRKLPGGHDRFGDWDPPDDLTIDQMFMAMKMPPVFHEA
jgi:hypothetical protein